jgi:hypothetical protein
MAARAGLRWDGSISSFSFLFIFLFRQVPESIRRKIKRKKKEKDEMRRPGQRQASPLAGTVWARASALTYRCSL